MPKIDEIYPNCDQNLEYNTKTAIKAILYDTLKMALKQYDRREIKHLKYRPVIDFALASYYKALPCFEEYFEKDFSQDEIYQAICNSSNYPNYLLVQRRFGKLGLQPQKLFVLKEEWLLKTLPLKFDKIIERP